MEIALQIASLGVVVLGGLIALTNGRVLINELSGTFIRDAKAKDRALILEKLGAQIVELKKAEK